MINDSQEKISKFFYTIIAVAFLRQIPVIAIEIYHLVVNANLDEPYILMISVFLSLSEVLFAVVLSQSIKWVILTQERHLKANSYFNDDSVPNQHSLNIHD